MIVEREPFIWRTMCRIFWFDEFCHSALERGEIQVFTYLSSGQEAAPATLAWSLRNHKINLFCQHRNHAAYIAFGGDPARLREELRGQRPGTSGGIGGDPCHQFATERVKMWGHDGLVGSQVPIGVGMAYATGQWSVIFLGDATVEEDYCWPAVGFAASKNLPVLFVCENNDLSVITRVRTRRTWESYMVARALGAQSLISDDDVIALDDWTPDSQPTFLELFCERKYRHVGHGIDEPLKFDRMEQMRTHMRANHAEIADEIEATARQEMAAIWGSSL